MTFYATLLAPVFWAAVTASLSAAPETLVVNAAQSRVEIVVKATVDSFTGRLEAYQAAVSVDDGHIVAATLRFNFADIATGKKSRDEAMNDWQETAAHPDAIFTLAALEPAAASDGHFNARGTLRLHDVSREITFPVSVITDHRLYAIDGEARLDTRDFGLPVIRKFGLLRVDPFVKVRFHLQGAVRVATKNSG